MKAEKNKKSNIIEEYILSGNQTNNHYDELFNPDNERIDVKTELSQTEIGYINTLLHNQRYLQSRGINFTMNDDIIKKYMRLKVSKDRKSRQEYVEVNKNPEQNGEGFGKAFQNMIPK